VLDSNPILCVPNPYAERDFFSLFAFEMIYEGNESPGFLAIRCGIVTAVTCSLDSHCHWTTTRPDA
jgi:hypothetical protein